MPRFVRAAAALVIVASGMAGVPAAAVSGQSAQPSTASSSPPVMDDYPLAEYDEEAAALPPTMIDALDRDLGISPQEYLASADAAVDAPEVVAGLADAGVDVVGSKIDGTRLNVLVGSERDFEAVRAVGGVPVLGGSEERATTDRTFRAFEDLRGGSAYSFTDGPDRFTCSTGFNGRRLGDGAQQLVTAGHCAGDSSSYRVLNQNRPGQSGSLGTFIGSGGPFLFGNYYDAGLISVTGAGLVTPPEVLTWGGGANAPLSSPPIQVRSAAPATEGAFACKSGSTTGWTCGTVLEVDVDVDVDGTPVNLILTDLCMLPGDSGGAALIGSVAIGINSAGTAVGGCSPGDLAGFFPMVSSEGWESVEDAFGSFWEPSVKVEAPVPSVVEADYTLFAGRPLQGTLSQGGALHRVEVFVDGSPTPRVASVSTSGQWEMSTAGLSLGSHSYSMTARWGTWSQSSARTGSFEIVGQPTVRRLSGSDRFEVAVNISKEAFPTGADVMYLATGLNYPDALSTAPAAVREGAPLLLTAPTSLPASVRGEIERLDADRIVVVGGPVSVSPAVFTELEGLAGTVDRISGADRYAVSRSVVEYAFDDAATVYVTTGTNFPDALSAGGAGGFTSAPVVLVYGPSLNADVPTLELLDELGVSSVKVAGGPNSVTPSLQSSLAARYPTERLSGADRFAASRTINRDVYTASGTVYLATGVNYPDALAGSALAGKSGSPLYVVPQNCIPRGVLSDIGAMGATSVVLLGGPNSLNGTVASLGPCAF